MSADSDSVELLRIGLRQVSVLDFARQDDLIWRAPFLACLDETQRESLLGQSAALTVGGGRPILAEEERPAHLLLLLEGSVGLSSSGVDIQTLGKGDVFGLACLFNDALRPAAQAGPDGARLALLTPALVRSLLEAQPGFGRKLAAAAQERKARASECADFLDMW